MDYKTTNADLCKRIQRGDAEAQAELLRLNENMVCNYVNKLKERHMLNHMFEWQDAAQLARMGILRAAESYDADKGAFSTYCYYYMHALTHEEFLISLTPFSAPQNKQALERAETRNMLYTEVVDISELQDDPAYEEVSIDHTKDTEGQVVYKEDLRNIYRAICVLPYREQIIMICRYGLDGEKTMTLEEIGNMFHLSKDRISQIIAKSLRRLRHVSTIQQAYAGGFCSATCDRTGYEKMYRSLFDRSNSETEALVKRSNKECPPMFSSVNNRSKGQLVKTACDIYVLYMNTPEEQNVLDTLKHLGFNTVKIVNIIKNNLELTPQRIQYCAESKNTMSILARDVYKTSGDELTMKILTALGYIE